LDIYGIDTSPLLFLKISSEQIRNFTNIMARGECGRETVEKYIAV
jgi:hypothetical protein